MRDMKQQSLYFKSVLDKMMKQPFVEKHINQPFIDEDKLQLSYYLFHDETKTWKSVEKYIIATILIQIAIDIHERIPSEHDNPIAEIEKQLSVLVGDYYSGMYYYILSELEDIDMIRIVAQSVKDINEQKMNIYYHHVDSAEQFIHALTIIESAFFTQLVSSRSDNELIQVIETFLLLGRIQKEMKQIASGQFSYAGQFINRQNELQQQSLDAYHWLEQLYILECDKLIHLTEAVSRQYEDICHWMVKQHEPLLNITAVKEGLR